MTVPREAQEVYNICDLNGRELDSTIFLFSIVTRLSFSRLISPHLFIIELQISDLVSITTYHGFASHQKKISWNSFCDLPAIKGNMHLYIQDVNSILSTDLKPSRFDADQLHCLIDHWILWIEHNFKS